MYKRIIALFLVLVISFSCVPFAFAEYSNDDFSSLGYWDQFLMALTKISSSTDFGGYVQALSGQLSAGTCSMSDDGYHHADTPDRVGTFRKGFNSNSSTATAYCTCKYCGQSFEDVVSASDLQQSYDAQVAELPATGYNSAGCLMWQPTVADIDYSRFESQTVSGGTGYEIVKKLPHTYSYGEAYYSISSNVNGTGLEYISSGGSNMFNLCTGIYFKVPVSGSYRYDKITCSYNILLVSGQRLSDIVIFEPDPVGFSHSETGCKLYFGYGPVDLASRKDVSYGTASVPFPIYEVIPDTAISGDAYTINSRPTSITGDYGIIGDNGQIIKVEGDKIVNETNNTYINPATGTTDTITDWSYDYSTRTYTLTLGGGTTTTVTYGDENVIIKEGDTTYNIYYLINGSGSENPDPGPDVPGPCNHQWSETSSTPATCTVPGSRTLTCSLCNETKTETIPAPGHKWTIKQEVKTEYDEEGNKTQDGYTIFECSVCGEQYKSTDGGAPPGGNTGTGSGSSGGVFSGIFGLLVDFLGFFWNTFRDFVGEGVKGFLTALMDGTSSIFGLLNPFNWGG